MNGAANKLVIVAAWLLVLMNALSKLVSTQKEPAAFMGGGFFYLSIFLTVSSKAVKSSALGR